MTTATIATVVDNSTDAAFRTWGQEINTQLAAVGLTQTADTGQINWTTVTRPAAVTAAGYEIWRFNDTLQATKPVFMKIEYGAGTTVNTTPMIWITIGTGSNGSGTINGVVGTRVAVCSNTAILSTVTSYTSRFCYNTTYGFLSLCWKIGGGGTAAQTLGGFVVCRSNDTTGAATGDAICLYTNSTSATGTVTGTGGGSQFVSTLTSSAFPTTLSQGNASCFWPFRLTTTSLSGNQQIVPHFAMTPKLILSNFLGLGLLTEVPLGTTFSLAIIGGTALTYISNGSMFALSSNQMTADTSSTGLTVYTLWQ